MKHSLKKIIALFSCIAVLALAIMPVVSAEEASVEWTLSDDEQTLTDGTVNYTYYKSVSASDLNAKRVYTYASDVYLEEHGFCAVCANPDVSDVVWINTGAQYYLYANEEGRAALDQWFLHREIGSYRAWDGDEVADLPNNLADAMDGAVLAQAAMRTVSVTELADLTRYEITAHDSLDLFSTPYGVVYQWTDGAYYYVNYWTLDNSYFDANGDFSYREGMVTLTLLNEELSSQFSDVIGATYDYDVDYEWESEGNLPQTPMVVFWMFFIFVGFVLPIPFIVLGTVFANLKKWGRPKYWYSLTVVGGLWMLLSALLAILFMCC